MSEPPQLETPLTAAIVLPAELAAAPGALDRLLARIGEHVNPILVKETRQALKSRQFTITFALLLLFGWGWSMLGPAVFGPEIRYAPKGTAMFIGYYLILAFPLLVIVPFSAFRSLIGESEEGTYELIAITTLRPSQIVSGKLASAGLQMAIYLSAIAPCVAFTYLLRGIDFLTMALAIFFTVLASLGLSLCGLLLATLTTEKHWQVVLSVVGIIGLLFTFMVNCQLASGMILMGGSAFGQPGFWNAPAIFLMNYAGYFLLLFFAATAQLTFASDNRSTRLRIAMLIEHAIIVASLAWGWLETDFPPDFFAVAALLLTLHWYVLGACMTAESPGLSLRVRRRLPQSLLGRAVFTWFNPGPATGYVFAVAAMLGMLAVVAIAAQFHPVSTAAAPTAAFRPPVGRFEIAAFAMLCVSYLTIYLGLGLALIRALRRICQVRRLLAILVQVLLVLLGTIVPFTIQLSSPELRHLDYSYLQITNPFWTLFEALGHWGVLLTYDLLWVILPLAALLVFVLNLPAIAREVGQVRVAKPVRVEEEDAQQNALQPTRKDPWDDAFPASDGGPADA